MKKHNRKTKARFKTRANDSQIKPRVVDIRPEDLAVYVHRAEGQVLATVKDLELSAGMAIILLAQYTQALIADNPRLTLESTMSMTESVIALWEIGAYQPGPLYPFTLEETHLDLQNGLQTKMDYSKCFQSFTPIVPRAPINIGQVAGGIVQHPKTHLWQIWIILDGSCEFLGAYHDSGIAQKMLEEIVNTIRQGGPGIAQSLYQNIVPRGDGEAQQIPYDMMSYLIDHLQAYMIDL